MKSRTSLRFVILGSALALVGAEFQGCDQHMTIKTSAAAYEAGVDLARNRTGSVEQGCRSLYPMPMAPLDLGDLSMDRVAQEAATDQASCRMGFVAASYGSRLRAEGQDVGLCQSLVDYAVTEAMPWLVLSGEQHLLNTQTCERAFHGTL
jgi:hypothetical protein